MHQRFDIVTGLLFYFIIVREIVIGRGDQLFDCNFVHWNVQFESVSRTSSPQRIGHLRKTKGMFGFYFYFSFLFCLFCFQNFVKKKLIIIKSYFLFFISNCYYFFHKMLEIRNIRNENRNQIGYNLLQKPVNSRFWKSGWILHRTRHWFKGWLVQLVYIFIY